MKKYLRPIFMGPFTGYRKFLFPKKDERGMPKQIRIPQEDREAIRITSWIWLFILIIAIVIEFNFSSNDLWRKIFFYSALFGDLGSILNLTNMDIA